MNLQVNVHDWSDCRDLNKNPVQFFDKQYASYPYLSNDSIIIRYIYEAEDAKLAETLKKEHLFTGFSGEGYIVFPIKSSVIEFNGIKGGEGGKAVLFIHYSFWTYEERSGILYVNEEPIQLTLKGTSAWERWKYTAIEIELNRGINNTIRIESGNQGFPNIDYIMVLPVSEKPLYHLSDKQLIFHPVKDHMIGIEILANSSWKITSIPVWLVCSSNTGKYHDIIRLATNGINESPDLKSGVITIVFNDEDTVNFTVTQEKHEQKKYYIDMYSGDDLNSGISPEEAWKTLEQVNSKIFGPGDTVLFKRDGVWTGMLSPTGSGTTNDRIVFSNYGNGSEKPLINAGGNDQAVWLKNMEHVVFEGFQITNPSVAPDRKARGIYIYADQPKAFRDITIRDNEIYNIIGWVKQNRRFSSGAIFTETWGDKSWFEDLLIEDNYIHDITTRGITGNAGASNWIDTTCLHNYIVIRNNLIDNTGCDAIRTIASKNVLVEYNTIYRAGNYTMGEEALYIAACFPQQCGNTTWQFNEIAYTAPTNPTSGDMDSQAFDVDINCVGTHVFQYNYAHDNAGGFFLFMGKIVENSEMGEFKEAIIRYNISQNDGNSFPRIFEIHDFKDKKLNVYIYNNVFYYDTDTMTIQLRGEKIDGIIFMNNIFYATAGWYPVDLSMVNNLYFGHHAPVHDKNSWNEDPLFVNPGSGTKGIASTVGYRIRPGSPASGNGKIIIGNGGKDFWGNPVPADKKPDIGVHQKTEKIRIK